MGFISTNVHITGHHPAGHAKLTVSTTTSILESRTHQKAVQVYTISQRKKQEISHIIYIHI